MTIQLGYVKFHNDGKTRLSKERDSLAMTAKKMGRDLAKVGFHLSQL
ncbi:hypothetical protein CK203_063647 [Vitis vinifera]|uniref:Uncharacterized protein n=1 Tax=Vitis vinifera TaxID=29760 RepID=A0A438G3Z2_VITVI|nr:hypothetical protein CK203_063647 [Vitis vinifera]